LEAGRLQTIRIVQVEKVKSGEFICAPVLSFRPEPKRSYELSMLNLGSMCRPVLVEVDGAEVKPVDIQLRQVHQSVLHSGSALCFDTPR